ncbi:MAG: lysophospholipid acyltransferase family protein [Armatimonadetes bacterium]|nr:lysophospholipid acyltransferase family protein [Armatimonadota bacterium]GIV13844.1 MAG: hypothetical protein KatS3mg021_2126 [Fimbriimonadales bacterium]
MVSAWRSLLERARLPNPIAALGRCFTEWLIQWSLRRHFRALYVRGMETPDPSRGWVFYANHHYWWDGYLCYQLARTWHRKAIGWMEAYRRFPPFGLLGALPFPPDNPARRAQTVRQTLEWLQSEKRVFFLFPEGRLHPNTHELLPFQRSLAWLAKRLPEVGVAPLAITIQPSYHQYPVAYLTVGEPLPEAWRTLPEEEFTCKAQACLKALLEEQFTHSLQIITEEDAQKFGYRLLLQGKLSAHERYGG